MMCNNPRLDFVNINAYIKFYENISSRSQDSEGKQNLALMKGRNSGKNLRKMMCNYPKLDLAKIKAYIKFGEILPIGS